MSANRSIDDDLLKTAGAWHMRLADSQTDRKALDVWLNADPRHSEAFDQVGRAWAMFDDPRETAWGQTERSAVLDRAHARRRSRTRRMLATLTAVAASIVLALFVWPMLSAADVYRTEPGERRSLALADGSRLTLDGASVVRVDYESDRRELWLEQGQARFEVAHDAARPFRVHARDQIVTATGTAFDVELLEPRIVVTLIQGRVVVTDAPSDAVPPVRTGKPMPTSFTMKAGERLILGAATAPPQLAPVDMAAATAWQDGRLIFKDEPLQQAVERLNRHTRRKIVLADPAARALRISGVFKTREADGFGQAIVGYLPIKIVAESETEVTLRTR